MSAFVTALGVRPWTAVGASRRRRSARCVRPQHAALRATLDAKRRVAAATEDKLPLASRLALGGSVLTLAGGAALPAALAHAEGVPLAAYGSHYAMLGLLAGFGAVHSGLAALRKYGTQLMGERLYRVLFAFASLPAAAATIGYFVAHRYDGAVLWSVRALPHAHDAVWVLTAASFALLYPATFDLLQVAAVKRPQIAIFERGVTRITRHPQLWGQVLWCVAHAAWLGSSFSCVASAGLVAHHLFGVWHGDRRLRDAYGERWEEYAARTSIVPFAAVAAGQQRIEWREFGAAYLGIALFVLVAYKAHPAVLAFVSGLPL